MENNAGLILREARESQNMSRIRLGMLVGTSEHTITRWETGEVEPDIEDVDSLERVLRRHGLLKRWMLAAHPCMARLISEEASANSLLGAANVVELRTQELLDTQTATIRDIAPDGRLDDMLLKERRKEKLKKLREAIDTELDYLLKE